MKILSLSLFALLIILVYVLNLQLRENRGLKMIADSAEGAIQYHETKNAELGNRIQFLEGKIAEYEAKISEEKSLVFKLKTEKDSAVQGIKKLENKQREQALTLEQKDNEILLLKNELLKYFQQAQTEQ